MTQRDWATMGRTDQLSGGGRVPSTCPVIHGVGVDLVYIPQFAGQLTESGSVFSHVFTGREWEYAMGLTNDQHRRMASLAARWAAKEAAIKAWSALLIGQDPMIEPDQLNWSHIEVIHDRWKRPVYRFHGSVASALRMLEEDVGGALHWSLSLSHDGDYAIASTQVLIYS
ncbi:4'-phosphopantetheinyl transferase superfamily protein [Schaalia sp. ZJ405]|uniref:4'-phosphopantetheinyl transferase superfamily protein n=1 Tax=Schaalia sp. ZJ405 TaxID=2709403 RepID=UPI001E4B6166|nr:4'-phosphopantetheinyl transferase superfamily protein [Schaalia sp. ZJ405]